MFSEVLPAVLSQQVLSCSENVALLHGQAGLRSGLKDGRTLPVKSLGFGLSW